MHRTTLRFLAASLASGALAVGCTMDFDAFEPVPTGGTGSGGAASSSSSTTAGTGGSGGSLFPTTTSSTTSSSSSTTTSSSTGTGGAPPTEDCLNGIDDDGDGDADCADTDCGAGFTCVEAAPMGWNGPIVLFQGATAQDPGCTLSFPTEAYLGHAGLVPEPATCAACACSTPQVSCVTNPLSFGDATCSTIYGAFPQPTPGQCQSVNIPSMTAGVSAMAPTAVPSPCNASGGMATLPPPNWQTVGRACGVLGEGKGCASTESCVPRPAAPFEAGLCVYTTGDMPCPQAFSQKHIFDDDVIDTRDCSACSCGAPMATCSATTTIHNNSSCGGNPLSLPNDGSCHAINGGSSIKVSVNATGSCVPSGGQPMGTISVGPSKTTVCCTM